MDPSRCHWPYPMARQADAPDRTPCHACTQTPVKSGECQKLLGVGGAGGWEQAAVILGKAGPLQLSKLKLHTPSTCSIVPQASLRKCKFKDKVGFQESEHRA